MQNKIKNPVHFSNYLVIIIGIALFVFRNFMTEAGEWGEEDHFFTKYLQGIHIMTTPFLIFFIGSIFNNHILKRLTNGHQNLRFSGVLLSTLFVVMVFSGLSIQVTTSDNLRYLSVLVHNISTALWVIFYLWHHYHGLKFSKFKFSRE